MKPVIKAMWSDSPGVELVNFVPATPEKFGVWIELRIGPEGSVAADDFRILVCTPKWLGEQTIVPKWGRHMLIVPEFDHASIERCIRDYLEECSGDDWQSVAEKLARNLVWEFEDYEP